ncbi:MAG: type II toxin-antitoxin system VapC family toxin [Bacteroidetes bacterium]|nr:type II toxin-antitoxin system VapC family toxin [Bacteroidota bacterium]
MSGTKNGLLDSNILVYCSKGQIDFQTIAQKYDHLFVSVITFMETLGFGFKNPAEKTLIETLLNALPIVQTDMDIANWVVNYRQQHKIKIPDAIILATARKLNAEVVTVNENDFNGIDPTVPIFVPAIVLS